jgi:hypothetical protein
MLTRLLFVLVLALSQIGWIGVVEEYKRVDLTPELRQELERLKRAFLQLEDIKIGDGPIAAWGRKVSADIEVRYADGTLIYRGPAFAYVGLEGSVFIHNSVHERGILSLQQDGIILGLNGMAVGGKRRMTVAPNLVCYGGNIGQSTANGANPRHICHLVVGENEIFVDVRKETLIVEATLTASCIPGIAGIPRVFTWESCRDTDTPRREPGDPILRAY